MRAVTGILLIASGVATAIFALHEWRMRQPSQVSGTVINSLTGQPVGGVLVREKHPNGWGNGVVSASDGRFTLLIPPPDRSIGIFVDDPHYAGLFGKLVGKEKRPLREGYQQKGITVPAIPAGALAGRVLDADGRPVVHCEVAQFRPASPRGPLQLIQEDGTAVFTGADGAYRFTRVDAGIYYLLAQCSHEMSPSHDMVWNPVLYPSANSLREARPVVVMPGQAITSLNIRVTQTQGYLLTGGFFWANGKVPKLAATDWGDFRKARQKQMTGFEWKTPFLAVKNQDNMQILHLR